MNVTDTPVIRVLLVDDHPLARQGIRTMLEQAPGIDVIGEASDGAEAQDLVAQLRPDVVLLDVEMPGPRACEVEAWIRENYPQTVGLVLSAHNRDAYLAEMLEAGAVGYLDKQLPAPQLVQAIRRAVQGESLFSVEQLHRAQRWRTDVQDRWNSLTAREQEVLRLLAQNVTIDEVARRLGVSPHTVETHLRNTVHKLQVDNRLEAVTWAWVNGIIERPAPER